MGQETARIQYACVCHRGLVRKNNQDNLVWERQCLPMENDGLGGPVVCERPLDSGVLFGVFDGMGGEPRGDAAAYIAADTAARWQADGTAEDMAELCREANRKICEFADRNGLTACGTTATLLLLEGRRAAGCNLGDSKILLWRNGRLTQLSEDHVLPLFSGGKPPLLQYLGIPETEMAVEPAEIEELLQAGDVYVICSDGLTDMVSADRIAEVLRSPGGVKEKAEALLDEALAAGGRDNITLILIRIVP